MSTDLEDEPTPEPHWHQNNDIELDELCAEYRQLEYSKKRYESEIKDLEVKLQAKAERIQRMMGGYKAVRTSAGYTIEWKSYKRKGYTVAASEGERWQLRSPY